MKVDLKNAFNKVSRKHVLRLVLEHFPGLARWVSWCCGGGDPPLLWFGDRTIPLQEGVQQGDPLCPLLFSLVIIPLSRAIATDCPVLKLHRWFLDDGIIGARRPRC